MNVGPLMPFSSSATDNMQNRKRVLTTAASATIFVLIAVQKGVGDGAIRECIRPVSSSSVPASAGSQVVYGTKTVLLDKPSTKGQNKTRYKRSPG